MITVQNDAACTNGEESSSPILGAALDYLRLGWSVFPIAAGTKKPPKRFRWKPFQKRLPTEGEIRDWFEGRCDLGVAVVFGEVSGGLVCRDFDDRVSYSKWRRSHPDLAQLLPTVETPRGKHVYFRALPEGLVFRDLRPAENGEYRGDSGHYCLLPPSPHPDGDLYRWTVPLSGGDLPLIEDVVAAGLFFGSDVTQKAQGILRKSQVSITPIAPSARGRLSASERIVVEEAISRTLPTGPSTRRKKLLELARILKYHPEFADTPSTDLDFLIPHLRGWWKQAKPRTSGKHPHFHQSWQDFVFAWEEARIPVGATMHGFLEAARSEPAPREAIEKYGEGSLRTLLASLCRVLQKRAGEKPFPLSGRVVGPLLGVSDTHAWRWIRQLEKDGLIRMAKIHPKGRRLATEWFYVGE